MGEAGPEGILPLKRINGRLGVEASGGVQDIQIIIENKSGVPLAAKPGSMNTRDDKKMVKSIVLDLSMNDPQFRSMFGRR